MISELLVAVFVAAALDTFIVTGYFTYGGAIALAASAAFSVGVQKYDVFIFALAGVLFAELLNASGFSFSFIKKAARTRVEAFNQSKRGKWLTKYSYSEVDSFAITFLKYSAFRFFALSRPINIVTLASTRDIGFLDALAVFAGSSIWVAFWVFFFDSLVSAFK